MSKFDETIKQMQDEIQDLENVVKEKADRLDDTAKQKAEELVEKTKTAINSSIEKVSAVVQDTIDEDKLNTFLESVQTKSKEAVDYTKAKIEEFANTTPKQNLDALLDEIVGDFDKVKETDTFKKASEFVKNIGDQVNDYLNKPEVKEAIDKAKKTTIVIAEKGVEGLKKVLTPEEIEKQNETVEEEKPEE